MTSDGAGDARMGEQSVAPPSFLVVMFFHFFLCFF